MANPKRKHSKQRTHKRRSTWKLDGPTLVRCPECHEAKLPHTVCPNCGKYDGREVIKIAEAE